MKRFIIVMGVRVVLAILVLLAGLSFSKRLKEDREKRSPFECGFTVKSLPRLPISLRFFLISVVFLIFDVELVLLFPVAVRNIQSGGLVAFRVLTLFILILLGGLFHEVNQGRLN